MFVPPCNPIHMCHWECMVDYKKRQDRDRLELNCPLCRAKINFDHGIKKKIEKVAAAEVDPTDAFELEKKKSQQENVVEATESKLMGPKLNINAPEP